MKILLEDLNDKVGREDIFKEVACRQWSGNPNAQRNSRLPYNFHGWQHCHAFCAATTGC
jgi:hypothetical protein